jgi:hypothetical protein
MSSIRQSLDGALARLVYDLTSPAGPPAEELARAIAGYRTAREGTLSILENLTQRETDFSPAAGAWSVGQNVEHLLLTDELYRGYLRTLIDLAQKGGEKHLTLTFTEIDTSIAYIPRDVIPMLSVPLTLLTTVMPRVVRENLFRLPLIPAVTPSATNPAARSYPVDELRARAAASLTALEEMFSGELPAGLAEVTLGHPLLGINNVPQIFRILEAHEERHHQQMRGTIDKARATPPQPDSRSSEPKSVFEISRETSGGADTQAKSGL